jgi:cytoskeleton protein RodZ
LARVVTASAGDGGNARKLPYWRDMARLRQDQELVEMEPLQSIETPPHERADGAPGAPPQRIGVGDLLRQKRESFRQDLFTVAGQLHIRLSYLRAIEEGRFRDLPGLTYASGFVRSYSDYLGLDGEEMVRRFRAEVAGMDRQVQLIFPSLVTEGKIPSGAILLLSGFLAVVAYGVWYYLADRQKSFLDLVPEVPAQLRALLGTQAPANGAQVPANGTQAPASGMTVSANTKPAPVVSASPVATHSEVTVASPPPPPPPAPPANSVLVNPGDLAPLPNELSTVVASADAAPSSAAGSANAAVATTAAATIAPPPAPVAAATSVPQTPATPVRPGQVVFANPGARIKLTARMDSWVQIYDKAGKSYFSAVLRSGQTIEVPNQPGLLLTTGNVGGLDILIDGQAMPALGSVGLVKRDLPLDPAGLRSAALASQ